MPISLKSGLLVLAALPLNALATEQWIVATDLWGNRNYQTLNLDVQGRQVKGSLDGDPIEGTLTGTQLTFAVKDSQGHPRPDAMAVSSRNT